MNNKSRSNNTKCRHCNSKKEEHNVVDEACPIRTSSMIFHFSKNKSFEADLGNTIENMEFYY